MGHYVLVARSRASAVFYPGDSFTLQFAPELGGFTLTFATTFMGGYDIPVPVDLIAEVRGEAGDVGEAVQRFGKAALDLSSLIGFATNASVGSPQVELVFDITPGATDHPFHQAFLPDIPVTVVPSRRIDVFLLKSVADAITKLAREGHSKDVARIFRSMHHYVDALRIWEVGHELTCSARLFMGVEALAKASLRQHLRRASKSEDDLKREWEITSESPRSKTLETEARRRLIFQDDDETYRKAKEVSDAFEHGYSDFDVIHQPARDTVVKMAEYLRRAILDVIGVDDKTKELVLGGQYSLPRGAAKLYPTFSGMLIGEPARFPAEGHTYPHLACQTRLKTVEIGDNGRYQFTLDESFTLRVGTGIEFRPARYERWDASMLGREMQVEEGAPRRQGTFRIVQSSPVSVVESTRTDESAPITVNDWRSMLRPILKWVGMTGSVLGAFLVAANVPISGWGYFPFLVGSLSLMGLGIVVRQPAMWILNGAFTLANVVGIWRWLLAT